MIIAQERRLDPRVRVQVRFELSGGARRSLRTTNLSASGARCVGDVTLREGDELGGRLLLPRRDGARDTVLGIDLRARVVHAESRGSRSRDEAHEYGLFFIEIGEADREELRSFLLETMAEDSSWHGPVGEDWR